MDDDALEIVIGGDASEAAAALDETREGLDEVGAAFESFAKAVDAASTVTATAWGRLAEGMTRGANAIQGALNDVSSALLGRYNQSIARAEASLGPQLKAAETLAQAQTALEARQLAAYEKYLAERDRLEQTYAARAAARRRDFNLQAAQIKNPEHPGDDATDADLAGYNTALARAMSKRAELLERGRLEEEAILKEGAAQNLVTEARYYEELAGIEREYAATHARLVDEQVAADDASAVSAERTQKLREAAILKQTEWEIAQADRQAEILERQQQIREAAGLKQMQWEIQQQEQAEKVRNAGLVQQDRDEAWLAADQTKAANQAQRAAAQAADQAEAQRKRQMSLGSPYLWERAGNTLLTGSAAMAAPLVGAGMAANSVDSQWMAAVNNTTLSMKDALALRQQVLQLMKALNKHSCHQPPHHP